MPSRLKEIDKSSLELLFLAILFIVSVFLRVTQLGYSDFYGDETKILFLRKDISATDFLFNQRKGPIQFIAAWGMEKAAGGFEDGFIEEGIIRYPFAVAGVLAVFAFYFLVKKMFGRVAGAFAALLFSLNGFFIAFSRTAQYQSFLVLFGILSILFAYSYLTELTKYKFFYLFISGVFLGVAFLSHYDAVFYAVPTGLILLKSIESDRHRWREVLILFLAPFFVITGIFYIPYIFGGYFTSQVVGYLSRRATGDTYSRHSTIYTYYTYNPAIIAFVPFVFSVFAFLGRFDRKRLAVFLWFAVPFVTFEVLIRNPGTHILNYVIPLIVLSSIGMAQVFRSINDRYLEKAYYSLFAAMFGVLFGISTTVFVPAANTGYPWKDAGVGIYRLTAASKIWNLFLYGFPYYRGWDKVHDHLIYENGVRNFSTNDNITIGEFYLYKYDVHRVWIERGIYPQYYIYVPNNQEIRYPDAGVLDKYNLVVDFSEKSFDSGKLNPDLAKIYRLK